MRKNYLCGHCQCCIMGKGIFSLAKTMILIWFSLCHGIESRRVPPHNYYILLYPWNIKNLIKF